MNNLIATLAVQPWIIVTLGIVVMVLAVGISIIVSLQSSKEGGGLSGTIAGSGAESFFGKSKALTKDRLLARLTIILSSVFVALVLVLTILAMNMA